MKSNLGKTKQDLPIILNVDENEICDQKQVANYFSSFIASKHAKNVMKNS